MVGFNNPSEVGQKQIDIQKLVYYIANNQCKKDNWRIYIIKFHEEWEKQYKNNLLNFGGKRIWGKNVLVDPNKKIVDVFNESMDNRVVEFFNMNNKINSQANEINVLKSTIKDLEESNETKQYLDELKDIEKSLRAIKNLLESDNLL